MEFLFTARRENKKISIDEKQATEKEETWPGGLFAETNFKWGLVVTYS